MKDKIEKRIEKLKLALILRDEGIVAITQVNLMKIHREIEILEKTLELK